MEFEWWWLLALPLFFALGWVAARIDIKHLLSESRSIPESYFKGLNFLLNQQQDKAIEAFIEVVKVDTQTVELHFALGGLFRRRGEVERAIRMHENILERSHLAASQRLAALFELAQDYFKAGLLDRAEELFNKLRGSDYEKNALAFLLDIYQQEKDWLQAIATARELGKISEQPRTKETAHFYCERAMADITHSRPDDARENLARALAENKKCARANVLLGDMDAANGHHEAALAAWKRVETQSAAHLALVAERVLQSYRQTGKLHEGVTLLKGYLANAPSLDILNALFQAVLETEGSEAAYYLLRDAVRRNPTLLGLDKLLEIQMTASDLSADRRHDLELVKKLVHHHASGLAMYRCEDCGFRARQFYWHCPACGGWDSYSPKRIEEKEATP